MFLAAGAQTLGDTVLAGCMDLVTVTFPWGSLLRGVLGLDPDALAGVAALVAPAGRVEVFASIVPSDRVERITSLDATSEPSICRAWADAGLDLTAMRLATREEIVATRSSWARRLRAGRDARAAWRFDLCRP